MRVIKSDSDFAMYKIIFGHFESRNSKLVLWQVRPENRERKILESRVNSFRPESNSLELKILSDISIKKELPLYIYSEDGQIIFKSQIIEINRENFSISVPTEIKLLEENDVKAIQNIIGAHLSVTESFRPFQLEEEADMVIKSMSERSLRDQDFLNNQFITLTLDEEEMVYSQMRESPRARPKIDKWLKIKAQTTNTIQEVRIYDLSRGGISFISMELDLFPKGTKIKVLSIDNFHLDDPLIAEVMSSRAIDELEIEYKIGCQFQEGQTS